MHNSTRILPPTPAETDRAHFLGKRTLTSSGVVYSFLTTAMTNHHKFSALKNTNVLFCSSGGQKSGISLTGQKVKVSSGLPSGGSREKSMSLPFPASRGCLYSLFCDSLVHLQGSSLQPLLPLSHLLLLPWTLLPPSYNDPCEYIRPTWKIQDNPPVSRSLT